MAALWEHVSLLFEETDTKFTQQTAWRHSSEVRCFFYREDNTPPQKSAEPFRDKDALCSCNEIFHFCKLSVILKYLSFYPFSSCFIFISIDVYTHSYNIPTVSVQVGLFKSDYEYGYCYVSTLFYKDSEYDVPCIFVFLINACLCMKRKEKRK